MKRKTRIERVYNEDTGWFETREVELNGYSFTDDDRIMIVREYMESGLPAEEIIKKYYINLLAELKNRLKISIFLWRKSCASR